MAHRRRLEANATAGNGAADKAGPPTPPLPRPQVLRGYTGDRSAKPVFPGSTPFDILGTGYQRPFELATLRLFNMGGILPRCKLPHAPQLPACVPTCFPAPPGTFAAPIIHYLQGLASRRQKT